MIQGMFDSGSLPVLERLMQFTGARHKVLMHNVANLSTPYFKPRDLDPKSFQAALGEAIDRRRQGVNPTGGPLKINDTRQIRFKEGGIDVRAEPAGGGVLFHDQNNRNLIRTMQNMAENGMAYNMGVELMRNRFDLLRSAIRERVV